MCGEQHGALYGITGYDTVGHWCYICNNIIPTILNPPPPSPPPPFVQNCVDTFVTATTVNIEGDDVAMSVSLPFSFPFYCTAYSSVGVSTNGLLTFGSVSSDYSNTDIPTTWDPNNYVAIFGLI